MGQLHNCGGVDITNGPKGIIVGPFYYAEQNACVKILTRCVSKMNVCFLSLPFLIKGTGTFNFESNLLL